MSNLKHIFGKSEFVDGVGEVYPIRLKDYDSFIECSTFLYLSKQHFRDEVRDKFSLLELLVFGLREDKLIQDFEILLSLVTRKSSSFFLNEDGSFGFRIESGEVIDKSNFDVVRQTIMRQNLLFEEKVYKDKFVQQYMSKVFQARAKSSVKMEFEDMISTVSVFAGKHYWDLEEYTIYQIKSEFNRVSKFKNYDTGIAFKCVSPEPVNVEHFAENMDMFKSPYDLDNFTNSKDKVNKLDKALGK